MWWKRWELQFKAKRLHFPYTICCPRPTKVQHMYIMLTSNTVCIIKNAHLSLLLGRSMFYLVWFSVVKQQHLPFLNIPEWEAQGLTCLFFIIWLSSQCCVWMSPLSLFFHKLHICVFTSRGLKARKPFQIDLQGRNQNSGDSWQVRTRPVREKQATRWCPHGQTRDSHPCTVKLYMSM